MDHWSRLGSKRLAVKEFPTAEDLASFEDVKIYLTRIDGHAAWVNKDVLDTYEITKETTVEAEPYWTASW